jgi:hypothetical protein
VPVVSPSGTASGSILVLREIGFGTILRANLQDPPGLAISQVQISANLRPLQ